MSEYNLIDEKWIPIFKDKKLQNVSLKECLINAHLIEDIYNDSPLVIVSLYRLMIAIVYRLFHPSSPEEWAEMWSKKQFDADTINVYFDKWHDRFYLIDDEYPFYQYAGELNKKDTSINKLILYRSSGNNSVYHDHSNEVIPNPIFLDEAAKNIITFQIYSVSGLSGGGDKNFMDSPLASAITTYLKGINLFESFWLNTLINPLIISDENDKPLWEKNKNEKDLQDIVGYLDYLTLRTRLVKLISEETADGKKIFLMKNAPGRSCKDIKDPYARYRISKTEGIYPLKAVATKSLWREYVTLTTLENKNERLSLNLIQAYELEQLGILHAGTIYNIYCGAQILATDNHAKIITWNFTSLPLPLYVLQDEDIMKSIRAAILYATEKAQRLMNKTKNVSKELISYKKDNEELKKKRSKDKKEKAIDQFSQSLSNESIFWGMLEVPFKEFVLKRSKETDYSENALSEWKRKCDESEKYCWQLVEDAVISFPRGPEAIAKIYNYNKVEV